MRRDETRRDETRRDETRRNKTKQGKVKLNKGNILFRMTSFRFLAKLIFFKTFLCFSLLGKLDFFNAKTAKKH